MVPVVCSNYCDEFQQRMPVGLLLGLLSIIPEDLWVKRLGKDYIWPFKPPKVGKSVCMSSIYDSSRHGCDCEFFTLTVSVLLEDDSSQHK
jgi:hypothetical protein